MFAEILTNIYEVISSIFSWVRPFFTVLTDNPLLSFPIYFTFASVGIAVVVSFVKKLGVGKKGIRRRSR